MAKEKIQNDVELARIQADIEIARIHADLEDAKSKDRFTTIRWAFTLIGLVAAIGIIALAAVRIAEKPAWLTFALAILATLSAPSLGLWGFKIFLVRRIQSDTTKTAEVMGKEPEETT